MLTCSCTYAHAQHCPIVLFHCSIAHVYRSVASAAHVNTADIRIHITLLSLQGALDTSC